MHALVLDQVFEDFLVVFESHVRNHIHHISLRILELNGSRFFIALALLVSVNVFFISPWHIIGLSGLRIERLEWFDLLDIIVLRHLSHQNLILIKIDCSFDGYIFTFIVCSMIIVYVTILAIVIN